MSKSEYGIDWKDINLADGYERDLRFLEPLTFDGILLQIECNCRELTEEAIHKEITRQITANAIEARQIIRDNLKNIVIHARKEREAI